jgi:hypothetical protein
MMNRAAAATTVAPVQNTTSPALQALAEARDHLKRGSDRLIRILAAHGPKS